MNHFIKDWADSEETAPLVEYVTKQLDAVIPPEEAHIKCIVVPESGLGRVNNEIAVHSRYGAVHAVEFSGLMHCCNQFLY